MRILLKLYATLTDHLPRDSEGRKPAHNQITLEVPEGSDVQSVIDLFNLPPRLVHLVLVNGVYVAPLTRSAHRLNPDDTLAIWPPIAGG